MKEVYYRVETALEELRKAMMDCVEYEGKSLTEWDEMCDAVSEKFQAKQLKKENERKKQENIKNGMKRTKKSKRNLKKNICTNNTPKIMSKNGKKISSYTVNKSMN